MYNDKSILIILGFILLCYCIFQELQFPITLIPIVYCLFTTITSPINEITV